MTTTTLTERESMIQIYSDLHKDAYGFRPRGINYHLFSLEELKEDFDTFERVCVENQKAEEEHNELASIEFEKRIQSVIDMGANDRQTALRWIVESYDKQEFWYGADFVVAFELGLGYSEYATKMQGELLPLIRTYIGGEV